MTAKLDISLLSLVTNRAYFHVLILRDLLILFSTQWPKAITTAVKW